jgi:hypothetical protein
MYKLWNKLFGWDYIQWSNTCDQGIARVFKERSGKVVYWRYRQTCVMDEIIRPSQVKWLTCRPQKYLAGWDDLDKPQGY